MKRILGLFLLLIVILMVWRDSNLWEDESYAVYVIDDQAYFGIKMDDEGTFHGRIEPEIVAIGSNVKFVVVARRIKESTIYFYIDKSVDNIYLNADEIIETGYSLERFNELKKRYGLPEFSTYF